MLLKARNKPKAKEVQQAYQRPAKISNNAIRAGRYQLEELLGNFLLEETEKKSIPVVLGFQNLEKRFGEFVIIIIGKAVNTMGPPPAIKKKKDSLVICQSSVSIKRLI